MTQNNTFLFFIISAVFTFGFVTNAEAGAVVRTGNAVSLADDQLIEGNFYSISQKAQISGQIEEDLVLGAGTVTINGGVGADATIFGGTVDVHGTVQDDLRVLGGEVIIAEPIMGDVLVVGGTVTLLSTGSVGGDVLLFAGDVELNGSVGGSVYGRVGTLRIDAPIAGDVDVAAEELTLGDRSDVGGSVLYESVSLLNRAPNAQIAGELQRKPPVYEKSPVSVRSIAVPFLIILFSVLVWYLVSKGTLIRIVNRSLNLGPRPILLGVGTIMLAPFAIGVLMVSMLGTLVGMSLLLGYVLFLLLASVGSVAVMGGLLLKVLGKTPPSVSIFSLLIGSLLFVVCLFVPIVGPLMITGLLVITFGSIIDLLLRSNPR